MSTFSVFSLYRHSEPAEESQQGVSTARSFGFAQDDDTLNKCHSEPAEESQQGVSTARSFDFAQDDNTLKNRHSEPAEESQ